MSNNHLPHQIALQNGDPTIEVCGIKLIRVDGGKFWMGSSSTKARDDEKPIHEVQLSSFYLSETPITFEQFKAFIDETHFITEAEKKGGSVALSGYRWVQMNGVNWRHGVTGILRGEEEAHHPVVHVSNKDNQAYCKWLSRKTKLKFDLPTEAQWEYAAKGGNQSKGYAFPGSDDVDEVAWQEENSGKNTHPVGQKKPNELGFYDMGGNVWEDCKDFYNPNYYENCLNAGLIIDPQGPARGGNRVVRGGSWLNDVSHCRSTARSNGPARASFGSSGFRVVVNI